MNLITRTTSRINDNAALRVTDTFWLLLNEDGTVDLHEVDETNTVDDITLGARIDTDLDIDAAIERVAASVTLDDALRTDIRHAFATTTLDDALAGIDSREDALAVREDILGGYGLDGSDTTGITPSDDEFAQICTTDDGVLGLTDAHGRRLTVGEAVADIDAWLTRRNGLLAGDQA